MPKPQHHRWPYQLWLGLATGLMLLATACSDDPESTTATDDGNTVDVADEPTNSLTKVSVWVDNQGPSNDRQLGRELALEIFRGTDQSLDHPAFWVLIPQDRTARYPDSLDNGLGYDESDSLVRDLENASDMCSGNQGKRCSFISISYQSCRPQTDCEHHTVTGLTRISAPDGLISSILMQRFNPVPGSQMVVEIIDQALVDYTSRGGLTDEMVKAESSLESASGQAELINKLGRALSKATSQLAEDGTGDNAEAQNEEFSPEEFFEVLGGLFIW